MARRTHRHGHRRLAAAALLPLAGGLVVAGAGPAGAEQAAFSDGGEEEITFATGTGAEVTCSVFWSVSKTSNEPEPGFTGHASMSIAGDPGCVANDYAQVQVFHTTSNGDALRASTQRFNGSDRLEVTASPVATVTRATVLVEWHDCISLTCEVSVDHTAPK
jgi:hypothetical protein